MKGSDVGWVIGTGIQNSLTKDKKKDNSNQVYLILKPVAENGESFEIVSN